MRDEAFTQESRLEAQCIAGLAERGDLQNEFIEITEDEANQIVARIRAKVDRHEQRLAPVRQPSPARVLVPAGAM